MKQTEQVAAYVRRNGSINALEAVRELGITRISAIVYKLKDSPHALTTRPSKTAEGFLDYVPDWEARQRFVVNRVLKGLEKGNTDLQTTRSVLLGGAYMLERIDSERRGGN